MPEQAKQADAVQMSFTRAHAAALYEAARGALDSIMAYAYLSEAQKEALNAYCTAYQYAMSTLHTPVEQSAPEDGDNAGDNA